MKDRQKQILRLLLTNATVLKIEEIAQTFGIGRRTVSRDLDTLDRWLSLRGVVLERKPSQGVRVNTLGKDSQALLSLVNIGEQFIETLPANTRQNLILLYLLFANREVKIAEIANSFFVSDTSVWNDLNQIELEIQTRGLGLERQKGIGIRLFGPEQSQRLHFIRTLSQLFSSRTIIPFLYGDQPDQPGTLEQERLRMVLRRIQFPENRETVLQLIANLSQAMGYQFTMSGEVLLFFYLQLSYHRIKTGALITSLQVKQHIPHQINPPQKALTAAAGALSQLTSRIFSGQLPQEETIILATILSVLEIGDLYDEQNFDPAQPIKDEPKDQPGNEPVSPQVVSLSQELIEAFGRIDRRLYYLNERLTNRFSHSLGALCTRIAYQIPYWHGNWGKTGGENWHQAEKLRALDSALEHLGIPELEFRDMEYLLLHFHALAQMGLEGSGLRPRCLVCCFEGIGLAAYLQTILAQEFPELDLVESTAVYKIRQSYLDDHRIDLILSTFPIHGLRTGVIHVELPLNRETIQDQVSQAVQTMKQTGSFNSRSAELETNRLPPPPIIDSATSSQPSFPSLWSFINNFMVLTHQQSPTIEARIHTVSRACTSTLAGSIELEGDFNARESLGALVIEEIGLRIIHCKSKAVQMPQAGIVLYPPENPTLFLIAPNPCSEAQRRMLSRITIGLLEKPKFASAILSGQIHQIRQELLGLYRDLL